MNKIWNRTPHLSLDLDLKNKRCEKRDLRSTTPSGHHHHSRLLTARRERGERDAVRREKRGRGSAGREREIVDG